MVTGLNSIRPATTAYTPVVLVWVVSPVSSSVWVLLWMRTAPLGTRRPDWLSKISSAV